MKTFVVVLIGVVSVAGFISAQESESQTAVSQPDPADELSKSIARGSALFMDPELGTNGMSCGSCHAQGGTIDATMGDTKIKAFDGLASQYPKYWASNGRVWTLDQVVNVCVVKAQSGTALAWDSQELADLVAYCVSVEPVPPETQTEGAGK